MSHKKRNVSTPKIQTTALFILFFRFREILLPPFLTVKSKKRKKKINKQIKPIDIPSLQEVTVSLRFGRGHDLEYRSNMWADDSDQVRSI